MLSQWNKHGGIGSDESFIQDFEVGPDFVVPATSVFVLGLFVAAWDFVQLQKAVWSLGVLNGLGLAMFVGGTILRAVGKRTLGRFYFMD